MPQLQRGGRVVVVAESRKISIVPQANISHNGSPVAALCQSAVAAVQGETPGVATDLWLFFVTYKYNRTAAVERMHAAF